MSVMTDKEREEFLVYLDKLEKEVTESKETARKFLVEVGIYTENGNLTEPYKNLYIPPLVEA